ncbi:Xaa-Pro aminopeptidase [Planctomycetes bacterium Pla163]|uniref:Xaa-Pro aminopeptidase n=1 Tax=Rohdeia mirabilis TaxID=2528008 RepID=A0A518CZU2_9BACT|nr:Xaa-Pro aminopeptidase [Planctomycetes bacterium Pla163]
MSSTPDLAPYLKNRARLLDALRERGAAAVVFTSDPRTRNSDSEYRFRPGSDFWWATGFAEPGSCLVLLPGRDGGETLLYCRERDVTAEIWNGRRVGIERAPKVLGVDEAHPIDDVFDDLPSLLTGYDEVFYTTGEEEHRDRAMEDVLESTRMAKKRGKRAPSSWSHAAGLIGELRLIKTDEEIAIMRRAGEVTAAAHRAAMAAARPGANEAEIDALIGYCFRRAGGNGEAYGNIVAGGSNACILHYHENDAELMAGELLLIDAGCEMECYAGDVTRTFPVDGVFTPDQRALYEVVLASEKAAIEAVRPGATFDTVHRTALEVLCEGLVRIGVFQGTAQELIASGGYSRVFMHKTSHWLGIDVHDCGAYFTADGASRPLEPGMVLTVEPGVYVAEDDDLIDARWHGMGIRIEDDVLVTASGHEVLTADAPKEIDAVEAACAESAALPV